MDTTALYARLVAAIGEMPTLHPDSRNDHYGSMYVSLGALLSAVRPVLARHGLAISQQIGCAFGQVTVRTAIIASDGGEITSVLAYPMPGRIHDFGAVVTYLRRYAIQAMLGLAAESDPDGGAPAASETRRARPARPAVRPDGVSPAIRERWQRVADQARALGIDAEPPAEETDAAYIASGKAIRAMIDSMLPEKEKETT